MGGVNVMSEVWGLAGKERVGSGRQPNAPERRMQHRFRTLGGATAMTSTCYSRIVKGRGSMGRQKRRRKPSHAQLKRGHPCTIRRPLQVLRFYLSCGIQ